MKKRYILSVAGIALAAVFFMQTTTPPEYTPEELAKAEQIGKQVEDTAVELQKALGSRSLEPRAPGSVGVETTVIQGASTEDPMQKVTNDAAADSDEEDQNSKELENPAENEMDKGADSEKSDNKDNENLEF